MERDLRKAELNLATSTQQAVELQGELEQARTELAHAAQVLATERALRTRFEAEMAGGLEATEDHLRILMQAEARLREVFWSFTPRLAKNEGHGQTAEVADREESGRG